MATLAFMFTHPAVEDIGINVMAYGQRSQRYATSQILRHQFCFELRTVTPAPANLLGIVLCHYKHPLIISWVLSLAYFNEIEKMPSPDAYANGERYEVLDVTEDAVTIAANGRAVKLAADEPLHLDHAYATTAHSSQGLTCNRVFYNAETTSRTTAQDTYYVGISRERYEVVVFTDNAQRLPDAVEREAYKGVAHDLVGQELQKSVSPMGFEKNALELSTG